MNESIKSILSDEIIQEIENCEQNNINNPDAYYTLYIHIVPKEISGYDHDKYYVGITKQNINKRWGHNGCNYKGLYFKNAIDKYEWDNIEHIVISNALLREESFNFERKLIKHLKSNNKVLGYNISEGGEGGNRTQCIPVSKYTLDGEYIETYNSAADASLSIGCDRTNITHACKTGGKTHGYLWRYAIDSDKSIYSYYRKNYSPVCKLSMDEEILDFYESLTIASQKIIKENPNVIFDNVKTCISRCCQGKYKYSCGYKWKYLKDIKESDITDSFLLQKYQDLMKKEAIKHGQLIE